MSGQHRRTTSGLRRRVLATAAALAAAVGIVTTVQMPGVYGAYSARVTNTTDTVASNPYFTCTAAVQGESTANRATFAYPFGENTVTGLLGAADVSGNGNTGGYVGGVAYGTANSTGDTACARDGNTVVTLNGATGNIAGPVARTAAPTTFTVEIWFRTTTGGGRLIGFGDTRPTLLNPTVLSTNDDRHLYLDPTGHLYFGVKPAAGTKTVQTTGTKTYLDGKWHQAIATLTTAAQPNGAPAGMTLYVDGVQVAADPGTVTAASYNGYWRVGGDTLSGWPGAGGNFFRGDLTFAAAYSGYALGPAQIRAHYTAGR